MPTHFFIESGKNGPGPTYKTLDKILEALELGVISDFPKVLYSLVDSQIDVIQEHTEYWCKIHGIEHVPRVIPIRALQVYKKEPLTLITGFFGSDPQRLRLELKDILASGSEVIVANGVIGYPSYILKVQPGEWSYVSVSKSLRQITDLKSRLMLSSDTGVHYRATQEQISKVIINNPFNWVDTRKTSISEIVEILKPILEKIPENVEVNIVCKSSSEVSALERILPVLGINLQANRFLRGPDYSVKQQITAGTLVIAEGVGVMEDCLATKGAIGIQFIKWGNQRIPSLFSALLDYQSDKSSTDYQIFSMYNHWQNSTNAIRNLIEGCFSGPSEIRRRFMHFSLIYEQFRDSLFEADKSILEGLIEVSSLLSRQLRPNLCKL